MIGPTQTARPGACSKLGSKSLDFDGQALFPRLLDFRRHQASRVSSAVAVVASMKQQVPSINEIIGMFKRKHLSPSPQSQQTRRRPRVDAGSRNVEP